MPLSIPGPSTLIGVAGKGVDSLERAIALVPRLTVIVTEVEALVTRVQAAVEALELTQERAQAVLQRTETVVEEAATLTGKASALIERMQPLADQLAPLAQEFEPTLRQLEPMLRRVAETTDPDEVAAVVSMIDMLPEVVGKFRDDIVPVIDTMGTVAPDLRDLLDVSKELNGMLAGLPGLGRIKRRVEEEQDREDAYRADEEPPAAPDRG